MSSYKLLIVAAVLVPATLAAAQAPPSGQANDRAVTIGLIRNPDANAPDEIVSKIPASQSRTRAKTSDDTDTELASPRDKSASGENPGTPVDPGPVIPVDPASPDSPATPSGPVPGSGPTTPPPPAAPDPP